MQSIIKKKQVSTFLICLMAFLGSLSAQTGPVVDSTKAKVINPTKVGVVPKEKTEEVIREQILPSDASDVPSPSSPKKKLSKEKSSTPKIEDKPKTAKNFSNTKVSKENLDKKSTLSIDQPRPPRAIDLAYNAGMNLSAASGNLNAFNLIPNLNLNLRTPYFGLASNMLYNFSKIDGIKYNSDFNFLNDAKFFTNGRTVTNPDGSISPASRFSFDLITNVMTSNIRGIGRRFSVGFGIGYLLADKPNNRLSARLTPIFETTKFDNNVFINDANATSNIRKTWGPLMALNGNALVGPNRNLIFNYGVYALPVLNKDNDFRWGGNLTFAVPVVGGLSLQTSLLYTHEKVILQDRENGDLYFTVGLGFTGWQ